MDNSADFVAVINIYQNEIGLVSPLAAEKLTDLIDDYSGAWVTEAIKEAVRHNARNMAYIEGVLDGWKINGFKIKPVKSMKPYCMDPPKQEQLPCAKCWGKGYMEYVTDQGDGTPMIVKVNCDCKKKLPSWAEKIGISV